MLKKRAHHVYLFANMTDGPDTRDTFQKLSEEYFLCGTTEDMTHFQSALGELHELFE